jgi:hypothetical protein
MIDIGRLETRVQNSVGPNNIRIQCIGLCGHPYHLNRSPVSSGGRWILVGVTAQDRLVDNGQVCDY